MSDQRDYNQQFEQQNQQTWSGGTPPPPGPPPPAPTNYVSLPGKKSPVLAGILSGIFPGLGNIYVGFTTRGFVQAMVTIFCIVALSTNLSYQIEPLFGVFLGFWWFFCIIDSVRRAGALNLHLAGVNPMSSMPQDLEIPSQGSKGWGLALIVAGVVFLLNTTMGFSLEWLEEWWPMFLIAGGAWLYWKARQSDKEPSSSDSSAPYGE